MRTNLTVALTSFQICLSSAVDLLHLKFRTTWLLATTIDCPSSPMSGLALLSGYGSDSDSDDGAPSAVQSAASKGATTAAAAAAAATATNSAKPSSSRLGSLLPPPKSASASPKSNASGLSLPPPTASKRKMIKIGSLQSVDQRPDQEDSDVVETKKPRLGTASTSKHSLFGMLPAPKRKDDEVLAERKKEADKRKADKVLDESETPSIVEAPLKIVQDVDRSVSPEVPTGGEVENSKPKAKTNDAFRAMLGLKPAAKKPPATPLDASITPVAKPNHTTTGAHKQSASPKPTQPTAATSKVHAAPVDFFSLNTPLSNLKSASVTSSNSTVSISAAPAIDAPQQRESHSASEENEESYPGWALDPDGSWVPITPEAQAQLNAYQASLSPPPPPATTSSSSRGASNLDGTRDLLAAGLTPEDIASFDAASAARNAYVENDGADSDKYAIAAEFAAGNRDAGMQQRKPGMVKGLRKGQLSSLISLANENRGKLEEKWQRGRDGQAQRARRYGW